MKLTDAQIAQIKDRVGAEPVPAESPATAMLSGHFGHHTFYVNEEGLHVFEAVDDTVERGPCEVHPVRLATWTSEKRDALSRHDPVIGAAKVIIDIES